MVLTTVSIESFLNAYFPLGMTAGGFRTWWRRIMDDTKLDNTHLI